MDINITKVGADVSS